MIVSVAGAGAGKTTKMSDIILGQDIPEGKIIFCIAFTNAAADNIKEKIVGRLGDVPKNIKISTIHSFLFQELIKPYYYFLYRKQFRGLSTIKLPLDIKYRCAKLSQLESDDILHITKIPEKAKWVAYQKSGDTKAIKDIRQKVLSSFNSYCAAIFVDESQDISEEIFQIFSALEKSGVKIHLYGDPKQDIKGFGCFRKIIDNSINTVDYISECHRCPQLHLNLSNILANDMEKQKADDENVVGGLEIVFESDINNIRYYIESNDFGLCYISQKNERFLTHDVIKSDDRFEKLQLEVYNAMVKKWERRKNEIEIARAAFFVTEKMLQEYDQGKTAPYIISKYINKRFFNCLDNRHYMQMKSAFSVKETIPKDAVVIRSIEAVKGLEAERCLFVLTSDLAPYLLRTKTDDNKMSHLLYVALTRSKDNLKILITYEVESLFTRKIILEFFEKYL